MLYYNFVNISYLNNSLNKCVKAVHVDFTANSSGDIYVTSLTKLGISNIRTLSLDLFYIGENMAYNINNFPATYAYLNDDEIRVTGCSSGGRYRIAYLYIPV